MSVPISRVEEIAGYLSLDVPGFFRRAKIGNDKIEKIIKGNVVLLDPATISKVVRAYPEINLHFLFTGTGPLLYEDQATRKALNKRIIELRKEIQMWRTRYYELYDQIYEGQENQ